MFHAHEFKSFSTRFLGLWDIWRRVGQSTEGAGKETYGAGRFLDIALPKNLKVPAIVVLDFNEAYNPPCVFTAYATCPLTPPQNRLSLSVRAGELMYNGHH